MARFKKGWGEDDHAEFDALVAEVESVDASTADRGALFMALIDDAIQAQRMWARDVERASRLTGFKAIWYRIQRRGSKLVFINGREVEKPAQVSVKRAGADGQQYMQLEFFDRLSLAQVIDGRRQARKIQNAYGETVAMYTRTESFITSAGATSVPEAEAIHGISLDRWLASEVAA